MNKNYHLIFTSLLLIFLTNSLCAQALCTACKDIYSAMQLIDQKIAASPTVADVKTGIGSLTQEWNTRASRLGTCKAGDPNCDANALNKESEVVNLMKYYLNVLDQTLGTPNMTKPEVTTAIAGFRNDTLKDLNKLCGSYTIGANCSK